MSLFPYVLFFAAVLSLAIGLAAWRHARERGMQLFAWLMLSAGLWSFGQGMEALATTVSMQIGWAKFQYLGIATLPVLWFLFAVDYSGKPGGISRSIRAALWIVPVITILLVLTNERHGLIWSSVTAAASTPGTPLVYGHGRWFWLGAAYGYALIIAGVAVLISAALRAPRTDRAQSVLLAAGALAPLVCNLLYLSGFAANDLTPVGFAISGVVYGWNIIQFRFIELLPAARAKLVDDLKDGVLVLNAQNQIVDINHAAREILGLAPDQSLGAEDIGELSPGWSRIIDQLDGGTPPGEATLANGEGIRQDFEISLSRISQDGDQRAGKLIVIHDISSRKSAERDLLESEARFRMLLETAPEAIILTDTHGKIIQANLRVGELFGYQPADLAGRSIRELIPAYPAAMREADASGTFDQSSRPSAIGHEVNGLLADGREIPVSLSYSPLITADGVLFTNIIQDLTGLRQTELQLRLQAAALNAAANAIVLTTIEGTILWVNPAFTEITGYLPHEVIGHSTRILRSGEHGQGFYRQMWETILAGEVWRGEITNRRKDGALYTESQTISPVLDSRGKITNFIAVKQDISEQKRADQQMSQRARELAIINEIGQAAASNLDLDALIKLVGDKIQQIFGAWMVYIALLDQRSGLIQFPYCVVEGQPVPDPQPLHQGEGLTSLVIRDGEPLLIDEDYVEQADRLGAVLNSTPSLVRPKTWIGVPISIGERVIGVLSIQDAQREHAYGGEDLKVLTTIAANLGVAIHNAQLYKTEQQRRVLAETLQEVNAAITASLRRAEVLNIILQQLRRVVSFDAASIMQWDEQKSLHIEAHIGLTEQTSLEFVPTPENAPNLWMAIETRTSVIVSDTRRGPAQAENGSARSWIGIPLVYQDQVTGFLNIESRTPGAYTEDDVRIASVFADQAAIAIENARLYEKAQFEIAHRKQTEVTLREANRSMLQQVKEITALQEQLREQALRDPVTGLFNRRYLDESLPREISRAEREKAGLGVIMMDLDHFKKINDAFGHINGDRALVALGRLLAERTRSSDIACRFGGEEFCLIMPGASLKTVAGRAEELRAAFERIEIETDRGRFHVTISLGASIYPQHGQDSDTLLSRADEALYLAKQAGRNRVVINPA